MQGDWGYSTHNKKLRKLDRWRDAGDISVGERKRKKQDYLNEDGITRR